MQILCLQKQYLGQKLNLPDMSEAVNIPADGVIEVPDAVGKILCDDKNWSEIGKKNSKKVINAKEDEEEETEEEETEEAASKKTTSATTAELIKELDGMNLEQLCVLAEQTNIKGWKAFKNKENALRTLIKNNLSKTE